MSDWMSEATRRIALGTPTPEIVAEKKAKAEARLEKKRAAQRMYSMRHYKKAMADDAEHAQINARRADYYAQKKLDPKWKKWNAERQKAWMRKHPGYGRKYAEKYIQSNREYLRLLQRILQRIKADTYARKPTASLPDDLEAIAAYRQGVVPKAIKKRIPPEKWRILTENGSFK